jgi:hypothetical protein
MPITMTVLRDGYWDGIYARPGEAIVVADEWVDTLITAQFATPEGAAWPPETQSTLPPGPTTPKTASLTPRAKSTA